MFEETANAPASFAAARAALGVAALRVFSAILRDAEAAYLQAVIATPAPTPTFVQLPRDWLPDSLFRDGAGRTDPLYERPNCILIKALYGHPEAGALWEVKLDNIMGSKGWSLSKTAAGVYIYIYPQ